MSRAGACLGLLMLAGTAFAAGHPAKSENIACNTGPITRTYGGQSWLVYSCADKQSVLVISNHGGSPHDAYIMLSPARDHVVVLGEGWGAGTSGNAAFVELKRMSARQLGMLVAETRRAGR